MLKTDIELDSEVDVGDSDGLESVSEEGFCRAVLMVGLLYFPIICFSAED